MMAHACNPTTQKVEAGGLLGIQGQLVLPREYQDSQGYVARPYLKTK